MANEASDNQYDTEHVVLWVRWLQAKGLEPKAIGDEIDRWSLDDVTQGVKDMHRSPGTVPHSSSNNERRCNRYRPVALCEPKSNTLLSGG
jgi:hypothetical protein